MQSFFHAGALHIATQLYTHFQFWLPEIADVVKIFRRGNSLFEVEKCPSVKFSSQKK